MSQLDAATGIEVRAYRPADESAVMRVLEAALGKGPYRSPEFFRWKHQQNPFGPSFMLVAEHEGRVIGLRAFMRWRFRSGRRTLTAVQAVDTATHPEYQGLGVFSKLTSQALNELRREVDLIFNTPNAASLRGYLKLGWTEVGDIPVSVRINRPVRFALGARSIGSDASPPEPAPSVTAASVQTVLADQRVPDLLESSVPATDNRLMTIRDVEYLRWRYADVPLLDYRVVTEDVRGRLRGLAIFRVRPRGGLWETTVAEAMVAPNDAGTARRLFRKIRRAARVDHLACHFPRASATARGARLAGYIRSPRGVTFVVNPLRPSDGPDPTQPSAWALSLGDVEVF